MLKNILAAALNNLTRNRLYAAISILGLAVAMAAAILTGLYIRDELSFDGFIPGSENVRVVVSATKPSGRDTLFSDQTPTFLSAQMKAELPEMQSSARIMEVTSSTRHGEIESMEKLAWADPNFFDILPLPAVAGDPRATLRRPDGVVLTRSAARKFFGQDEPLGQVLELNRVIQMKVGAVIEDIPGNSHLQTQIFPSGLNQRSIIRRGESQRQPSRGSFNISSVTYARFANAEAAARAEARLPDLVRKYYALPDGKMTGGVLLWFKLVPLDKLHLFPLNVLLRKPGSQGSPTLLTALAIVAAMILLMAGINFVNLMTARASQRMVEVGVRKMAGADRGHLILQFMGEALIYALLGLLFAIALVELALPTARAVLERPLAFQYWRDPPLLGAALLMSLGVGLLAGLYPAFVQSSFRPVMVLKGRVPLTKRGLGVREGLVLSQFAILIALILSAMVVTAQTHFVMNEGLRVNKDQMLMMEVNQPPDLSKPVEVRRRILCREAFIQRVRDLPGVAGAACSNSTTVGQGEGLTNVTGPSGQSVTLSIGITDYGFFELYGLKPVAGRFFNQPGDAAPDSRPPSPPRVLILNESAVRALGFKSPSDAVGRTVNMPWGPPGNGDNPAKLVVGVAPDFEFDAMKSENRPMVYALQEGGLAMMHVKLKGDRIPETTRAIDRLWRETNFAKPAVHRFVDEYLQQLYAAVLKQGVGIDLLCAIAVLIGCLGLFGLAAFTAERRTKEIGIRKTMGAGERDIVQLMLWSFTRPVLWANLIAWPLGWWAMSRWLQGFSSRIELSPLFFLGAGGAALVIAAVTVSAHAFAIARAKPVGALRYE